MAKCEGCGKRATKWDADGVPLCSACYNEMALDHVEAQLATVVEELDKLRALIRVAQAQV